MINQASFFVSLFAKSVIIGYSITNFNSKPVTKYVTAISLVNKEDDMVEEYDEVVDIEVVEEGEVLGEKEIEDEVDENELDKSRDESPTRWRKYANKLMKMPKSYPIGYYLKHDINRKTIEGFIDNHEYNDALRKTRLEKLDKKVYELIAVGPLYDAILKKKLVKEKKRNDNFMILCTSIK
nr:hypothetical protein [Tanacetum cinerariifolium]